MRLHGPLTAVDRLPLRRELLEAATVAAGASLLAFVVNALRSDGLPPVARVAYQTLVPCPESAGEVKGVVADDPVVTDPRTVVVDARSPEGFAQWHYSGAMGMTFDYLDPLPAARLGLLIQRIERIGAHRVVVYGDGEHPDSGEQLGRELTRRGIRGVAFVRGGAPALRRAVASP